VLDNIFVWKTALTRHQEAPLLKERELYLSHLIKQGTSHGRARSVASALLRVIRVMEMSSLRSVSLDEIQQAGERWARDTVGHQTRSAGKKTALGFTYEAVNWFRFHGALMIAQPPVHPFAALTTDFLDALKFERGLSLETIRSYGSRVAKFLKWLADRHDSISSVCLYDIDDFLDCKRAAGWTAQTIATQCQALRTFFDYAETRGWCATGLRRGIRSPTIPKYNAVPRGPSWKDVRRLIRSTAGPESPDIRARAILLLCSIYALRGSEVARLRLEDFDWRNETLTVKRAKRGRVQQYPIQYEVGEAILRYLQEVRPHCSCRNVFVTRHPPHRPILSSTLWPIVSARLKALNIETEHFGPHSLRHACATRLLKQGSSLQEIADFLGHRSTKSVSIYAKFDTRSLRKVATFSMGWAR
jgi:integrase/recombinase XerD